MALFLNHPLPIAPRPPRAPGGHWAEQAQLNLEGLKGVMRCRARVKNHRPGFLSPEFERSATAFDNGPAKVAQPITATFGPYGQTNREPSSPAHPVEQRANCERKTGAKELDSSLRGTPIQWLSLQFDVRATKARKVGNENGKNAHAPA